ncbi:pilin [Marinobacter lutaoensis]|uniref:pilin n=1 Tax=Marinobacter lutaoensis TaxID=135739 RepID=UPI001593CC74|nr:pilin [Marinobacter lutaoensis]NVD36997.1 pilin [Marinobacter lutaoensis]
MKNIQVNHAQKGFTLIELMIVVAIIGILAAIAIPQYQAYVGKANFSSGLSTLTSLKTNVESFIMENGTFPKDTDVVAGTLGVEKDASEIGNISTDNAGLNTGAGYLNFNFTEGNPGINGKDIRLIRDADGVWTCKTTADADYVKACESVTSF